MPSSLIDISPVDNFRLARDEYRQTKNRLVYWINLLAGNITLVQGINMLDSVNLTIAKLQIYAADASLNIIAQAEYNDPTFDAVGILTTMITDLQAVSDWITAHLPNTTYTPTQTSALLALLQTTQADAI